MKMSIMKPMKSSTNPFDKRLYTVVIINNDIAVPFYRSTGYNSKCTNKWFPCLGHLTEEKTILDYLINSIYSRGKEKLLSDPRLGEGWIIKFRDRIGVNDKYISIIEHVSKALCDNVPINCEYSICDINEEIHKVMLKSDPIKTQSFIIACNIPSSHVQFDKFDIFEEEE